MRIKAVIFSAVFLVTFLSAVSIYYYVSPLRWKPVDSAKISYNGQEYGGSAVYRSSAGVYLLYLKDMAYVYFPEKQRLGIPTSEFYSFGPLVFCKKSMPHVFWYPDGVKVTGDPNLIVSEGAIEFTAFSDDRVKVIFGE